MQPETEEVLIDHALKGSERAYDELYRVNRDRVAAQVARAVRDRDDVEDLVQITFTRAFRALPRFRCDAAFSTWLTRIAMNVSVTHRRMEESRARKRDAYAWETAEGPPEPGGPEADLIARERRRTVHSRIRRLPRNYRRVLWLYYVRNRSYDEIRRALDIPMGTLKVWMHRGRVLLETDLRHLREDILN